MIKFKKIIINRQTEEYFNLPYLVEVRNLLNKYSRYLSDDYEVQSESDELRRLIDLVERVSPHFYIALNSENQFMGFVYLEKFVGSHKKYHSAELAVCMKPEFWGKTTRICARKFLKYCFKFFKFKKIKASIFVQNFKVKKLLKDLNFKKEGLLKAETIKNGLLQDVEVYALMNKSHSS